MKINKKLLIIIKKMYQFLNKHFYILPILSLLSKIRISKYYKITSWLIKLIIFINIIIGTGIIVYFTDFVNPFSIYYDFLKPYIDLIKQYFKNLINLEDTISSNIKDSKIIKNQIKEGIKEGVKEAFGEILDEMKDELNESDKAKSNLLTSVAVFGTTLFVFYLLFILPGSELSPLELSNYNWINQSLIEFKLNVINLFSKNPGPSGNTTPDNSPINPNINIIDDSISRVNSVAKAGSDSTITQYFKSE